MIFRLAFLVLILGSLPRCDFERMQKEQRQAEADLVQICSRLTIPDSAKLREEPIYRGSNRISILRKFRVEKSCGEIRDHLVEHFSALNWDRNRMKTLESGDAGDVYEFRERDYLVGVHCRGWSRRPNLGGMEVEVSCSWDIK